MHKCLEGSPGTPSEVWGHDIRQNQNQQRGDGTTRSPCPRPSGPWNGAASLSYKRALLQTASRKKAGTRVGNDRGPDELRQVLEHQGEDWRRISDPALHDALNEKRGSGLLMEGSSGERNNDRPTEGTAEARTVTEQPSVCPGQIAGGYGGTWQSLNSESTDADVRAFQQEAADCVEASHEGTRVILNRQQKRTLVKFAARNRKTALPTSEQLATLKIHSKPVAVIDMDKLMDKMSPERRKRVEELFRITLDAMTTEEAKQQALPKLRMVPAHADKLLQDDIIEKVEGQEVIRKEPKGDRRIFIDKAALCESFVVVELEKNRLRQINWPKEALLRSAYESEFSTRAPRERTNIILSGK